MSIEDILYPLLKVYIGAPQWVKTSIGETYSRLPRAWRHGPHRAAFARELHEHGGEAVRELARIKLRQTLEWALKTVPAYRQYEGLLNSSDDPEVLLKQLPLIGKADIKTDIERYISTTLHARERLKTFTGGSTANPMLFYLHKDVSRPKEYAFMDDFHARENGAIGAVQSYVATYAFYLVVTAGLVLVITRKMDRESKGEEI